MGSKTSFFIFSQLYNSGRFSSQSYHSFWVILEFGKQLASQPFNAANHHCHCTHLYQPQGSDGIRRHKQYLSFMLQEFQLAFGCTEVYMKDWRQYISFICVSQHPAAKPISQNHYFCILTSAFSMPIQVLFDT